MRRGSRRRATRDIQLISLRVPERSGRREGLASTAVASRREAPMLAGSLGGSGVGRAEIARARPVEPEPAHTGGGKARCVPHIPLLPPRRRDHARSPCHRRPRPRGGAARGRGEARARHLHLRELRLGVGAGAADRGELRGGLRLHRALRRRRRRGGAARAAAARGRAHAGRHRARARHQPDRGGEGDRALRAARAGPAGARPADRLGRRHLPALRLGLLRLRLRQDEDAGAAEELRGADRVGGDDRHPRPAQLDAGARAPDVGEGRLWRPGAGDLGGAGAAHRHGGAGVERGLRPLPRTARWTWRSPTPPRPPTT